MKKVILIAAVVGALLMTSCTESQQQEAREEMQELKAELKDDVVDASQFDYSDHGEQFFTVNIEDYTKGNTNFRTTVWTGKNMQMTLMEIPVGGEIGAEIHTSVEQFIRIEEGDGEVFLGDTEEGMVSVAKVSDDDVLFVPLGKWHNIKNIGDKPIKLYSIYAAPEHAKGTVHVTMEEGHASDHDH